MKFAKEGGVMATENDVAGVWATNCSAAHLVDSKQVVMERIAAALENIARSLAKMADTVQEVVRP